MKKIFFTFLLCSMALTSSSQTIFGKWENRDEETGKVDSVIEIYQKNGKAYAKIVEITDPKKQKNVCNKCEDHRKNKPILGMNILTGLTKDGDKWSDGEILDPKSGKIYGCYISLKNKNKLKVKGHLKGFSFIGRTVYWFKKN